MNQDQGIKSIAMAVAAAGGRAMLVGGFVRDSILAKDPKDCDIECFGISPEDLHSVLDNIAADTDGNVDCVGESFKVLKVSWGKGEDRIEFDVSIPRTDIKVGEGHKGFEVVGNPDASFEDASRRRDFTFNAILQDALTGQIIDPFDGEKDLIAGVLRVVDPVHFEEDSLRVLRAMQFVSRFRFQIDPKSESLMSKIYIGDLPKERLWGEFEKMLLKSQRPSVGMRAGVRLNIWQQIFPELHAFMQTDDGDMMLMMLDSAADACFFLDDFNDAEKLIIMLSTISMWINDPNDLMDAFGIFSKDGIDIRKNVNDNVSCLRWMPPIQECSDEDFRRISLRVNPNVFEAFLGARMDNADEVFFENMNRLGIWQEPLQPFLQGRDLIAMGVKPGKQMGDILKAVFERQIKGIVRNKGEAEDVVRFMI